MKKTQTPHDPKTQQDKPTFRLLNEGERIQAGDEMALIFNYNNSPGIISFHPVVCKPERIGSTTQDNEIIRRPLKEPAPQQWISVKERLPKREDGIVENQILPSEPRVLFRSYDGCVCTFFWNEFLSLEKWTHFLPIPPLLLQEEKEPREWKVVRNKKTDWEGLFPSDWTQWVRECGNYEVVRVREVIDEP